jgi:glyoxylase-like metal-dependent hydrolase (beta-lactamase superfamily II)
MTSSEPIISVPALQDDTRIRIFRRTFPPLEEFADMHVDAYVIVTARSVVICDTLLCPADMAFVMQHTRPALATGRHLLVLNSHADWDHTWGNCYFTGNNRAPILAQQLSRTRLQSAEAQAELLAYQKRDTLFQHVALTPPTLTWGDRDAQADGDARAYTIAPLQQPITSGDRDARAYAIAPLHQHVTFADGLTLHGGDLTLELFPAPGHSSDSSALWIPELRLLLAFDSIEAPFPLLENAQSVQPLINTLERFLALHPQHILCSHSKTADAALIHNNLAYIQKLVQRCHTLLLNHHPTDAEMQHPSELLASPFVEFAGEVDGTPAATFYQQAHEDNIRSILQSAINHWVE